jgi:hypothetical protein
VVVLLFVDSDTPSIYPWAFLFFLFPSSLLPSSLVGLGMSFYAEGLGITVACISISIGVCAGLFFFC